MTRADAMVLAPHTLTHLERLEAESIQVMREVVAECEKPVMLYSIGKDSAAMLHVALKAFYPGTLPFPLLHVDTLWKFKAMYELREQITQLEQTAKTSSAQLQQAREQLDARILRDLQEGARQQIKTALHALLPRQRDAGDCRTSRVRPAQTRYRPQHQLFHERASDRGGRPDL